jgi:hypothetical protein
MPLFTVEVHHHHDHTVLGELRLIHRKLEEIMVTQAEHAQALREVATQQRKTIGEIGTLQTTVTSLNTKVDELQKQLDDIGAGGELTQEVIDAFAEVKTLAQQADDEIPDVPTPPEQV